MGPWDPRRVKRRWPATIFAASRIERVPGRITLLTVSITTITGINAPGVPAGTRWAMILENWYVTEKIILPSHKGRPNLIVILKWLVLVKIYGKRPIKFENKKKILSR